MTLEEFKEALKKHDWFYSFSDDGRVFNRGQQMDSQLLAIARNGGDDFKRIYNSEYAKRWHTKQFSPPYKFPFPDFLPDPLDEY